MLKRIRSYFTKEQPAELEPEQKEKLRQIEEITGVTASNPIHFLKAIRHRSMLAEKQDYDDADSYERLEFLGDAVLDLISTEIIFELYPDENEGFLTKLRSKLVKGESLAHFARELDIGAIIEIGERARGQGIEYSKSILADIFEALVGAIYLDKGYEDAYRFVRYVIDNFVDFEKVTTSLDNYKSMLLEYSQAQGWPVPEYEVTGEYGPGHDKTFQIQVLVDGEPMGEGEGKSKKQAEQAAARQAMKDLHRRRNGR